jgi:hypothetical protein
MLLIAACASMARARGLFSYLDLHLSNQTLNQRAHLGHGGVFNLKVAFVLRQIAFLVRGVQYASAVGGPAQGVRQALKDGVILGRSYKPNRAVALVECAQAAINSGVNGLPSKAVQSTKLDIKTAHL